jgi:hypothetical protein
MVGCGQWALVRDPGASRAIAADLGQDPASGAARRLDDLRLHRLAATHLSV